MVVISHGLGGSSESYIAEILYFVNHGYKVFGYDNLDAALSFIEGEERFNEVPIFLYGHNWEGYAVTSIFNYEHEITASVSVAGFNKPMEMIMEWTKSMIGGFAYIEYPYIYLYQKMLFGNNANLSAVDGINATDTPVLIIHGSEDTTVKYDGAATIAYKEEITNPKVQYKICDKEK